MTDIKKSLVKVLLSASQSSKGSWPLGATLRDWCVETGVRVTFTELMLSDDVRKCMRDYLTSRGIDPYLVVDSLGSSREDAARISTNEKLLSVQPTKDMIQIKSFGGCLIYSDSDLSVGFGRGPNRVVTNIAGENSEIDCASLKKLRHSSLVVVENYEVFRKIHKCSWLPEELKNNAVFMLRSYHMGGYKFAIDNSVVPVHAMMDVDPKGLEMGSKYIRHEGSFIAPPMDQLIHLFRSPSEGGKASEELFFKQISGVKFRDQPIKEAIKNLWELVIKSEKGLAQEHFLY